ncbi:MAG: cyclic nucleotide-binding domain-containing protein [Myxococcota bacterium]|nr:cyclic nucleotide-binding domain-containing protein [Myxococcota bacterium]
MVHAMQHQPHAQEIKIIESHLAKNRMDAATEHYTKSRADLGYLLIERTGRDKDRLGRLATLFHRARHFRLVAECFDQLGDYARSGQMYEKAGDPANAAEMYWRAKVFARAAICYEASGSFTKAAELWLTMKDKLKAGMAFERAGEIYRAGKALLEANRADRAIPLLQKVPPDDFNFRGACLLAARGLHQAQMSDLAIRRLDMGINGAAIEEGNADLYLEQAVILMDRGQFHKAISPLEMLASWNFSYKDVAERLKRCKTSSAPAQSVQADQPKEAFDDARVRAGIEILQRHPLLAGLSLPQIRTLYDSFARQRVSEGAILIEAGEPNHYLFVLIKGTASVRTASGKELTQLGSGSWFGEMALIDDAMASAQVRAATPLAVLAIKHDDFQHLLDTHPDMAIQFYRHFAAEMARRLRASNERSE